MDLPKPEEEEKLFETIGKAADKIGETKVGQKIGAIIGVILLALLSGGANLTILEEYFNGDEDGPLGGCMQGPMLLTIILMLPLMMVVVIF